MFYDTNFLVKPSAELHWVVGSASHGIELSTSHFLVQNTKKVRTKLYWPEHMHAGNQDKPNRICAQTFAPGRLCIHRKE